MSRPKRNYAIAIVIGQKMQNAIENANLSRKSVCEYANISSQTLGNYLHGKRCPGYDVALKIAEITGTNVLDYLTPSEKERLKSQKIETVYTQNDVFVSFLDSIGCHVAIELQKNNNDLANIYHMRDFTEDDLKKYYESENRLNEYITNGDGYQLLNLVSGINTQEIDDRIKQTYNFTIQMQKKMESAATLNERQWNELKTEISQTIKNLVERRMKEININRNEFKFMLNEMLACCNAANESDLSEIKNRCNEMAKTLQTIKDKYI